MNSRNRAKDQGIGKTGVLLTNNNANSYLLPGKTIYAHRLLAKTRKNRRRARSLQFQCPLALAKTDEPPFSIFAYAPTTAYQHEHNLTLCPIRT